MSQIPLTEAVSDNLSRLQFSKLTPIQSSSIPVILAGSDLIGIAQTGSGKTLAFLLPILSKLLQSGPSEVKETEARPSVLILVPTRELADQVFTELRKLLFKTGLSAVRVYGGEGYTRQMTELGMGCDFLVATPGRLLDMFDRSLVSLSQVSWLVMDEADRMLDMGFTEQLQRIIEECDLPERSKRQNLLFSATFNSEVQGVASSYINKAIMVYSEEETTTNKNITQNFEKVENKGKLALLHNYLQTIKGSAMVFVKTKRGCDWLYFKLVTAKYNVTCIHGDKSQDQRNRAISAFRSGKVKILICTDVASRGLDFPRVEYVFNFDMPSNLDDYVHRIGRTGRVGNKGTAISFMNGDNLNVQSRLLDYLKKSNQTIPDWLYCLHKDAYETSWKPTRSSFRGKENFYPSSNKWKKFL